MSLTLFNFVDAKDKFTASARHALVGKTSKPLVNVFNQFPGNEAEKKTTLDQALRGVLGDQIVEKKVNCDEYLSLIYLSIDAVTEGICSATTPFLLLGDVLDCLPLDQCDKIFSFVEENVSTWKSSSFYTAGKNYLLRMCNDLLRRLSKSQNTVFCGRIQLFLARLFPLSEKSGLNLQSQFNLENVTVFNKNEQESTFGQKHTEEKEDGMEVEEGEMGEEEAPAPCSIPIDYNLYRKFWTLQDYFRNPVQCYDKFSWMTFLKFSDETLAVFKSYKLDDMQASKRKLEELRASGGEHVYFAKFLTSEKLMDLQLSDSNFRRHILLQYLILFQYLKGQVKFKSSSCVLNDDQTTWIEETTKLVFQTSSVRLKSTIQYLSS
uniref:THO complex 1 n=1 Tax=Gasterosteus aculeatus TaxID=69293 RepID=G3PZC5_GASAC